MSSITQLILNSDSVGATGVPSNFTTTLANTLNLNAFAHWEIAVLSATYSTPNPYTNKAIYIECDLADYSFVGNDRKRVVFKTNQDHPTPLENELTHILPKTPTWVKMTTLAFNTINIKIEDSDGVAVPNLKPSSVTLSIRSVA